MAKVIGKLSFDVIALLGLNQQQLTSESTGREWL